MTQAQLALYRFEWGRTRKWLRAHGRTPERADSMRHEIHKAALGVDKSSLDFTNADLDKVLAKLRSYSDGANLDAQLAAEEQPLMRIQALVANARDLAAAVVSRQGTERAYLDGLSRQLFKHPDYQTLDERQLQQLCGILARRKRKLANEPNPF